MMTDKPENSSWAVTEKFLWYGDHPNGSVMLHFLGDETIAKKVNKMTLPSLNRGYKDGPRGTDRMMEAPSVSLINYARSLIEIAGLMALDEF